MVTSHDMGMIINPKFPIYQECNWRVSCPKVLAVFRYKKVFPIKKIIVNMINNPRCAVIRVGAKSSVSLFYRNTDRITAVSRKSC